jgi:lipopolysaccharide/colanic/teichoic acid biosynthesis glycosyltransferase
VVKDFEEVVKLDCEYIDNWSLWLDFKIVARTIAKVVRGNAW